MSRGPTTSIPPHTHREFLAKSNLDCLIGQGRQDPLQRSFHQTSKSFSLKHDHKNCQADQDVFNKTASELKNVNFAHHNENCLCKDCHCGRHVCKLNVVKPEMTKNSIYQRSYYQKAFIPNQVNHDKEYDKLKGGHLDINSIYRNSFKGNNGDKVEKPHPEDLLKTGGPDLALTSYKSQFPGHVGNNQYVKPTDKHTRAQFPLRSKSTYAKEFVSKSPEKDDYKYFNDQLKTGYNWFGKTTYGAFFNSPNPEYHAKKAKIVEKRNDKIGFDHMYETVYRNDFIPKENPLCPAKVHLQTKDKGSKVDAKHSFAENSDFKALSPEFHAISTSKHWYV